MMVRRVSQATAGLVIVVIAVVALAGSHSAYTIVLRVADAQGLEQGSQVAVGGIRAGTVSAIRLAPRGGVVIDVALNGSQAPVGRNVTAAIASQNLLGQKEIVLTRGDLGEPAPSGFVVPGDHITVSTDLDQVLDVLDANTRARLAILANEAGAALVGERANISSLLAQLPSSLAETGAVVNQLVSDNHSLADTVRSSDEFVSTLDTRQHQLTRLIGVLGQASATFAQRRAALAATLAQAPATLIAVRGFLSTLQQTAQPLGPAARLITATAPSLLSTVAQLNPLRIAADPALAQATAIAPALTDLAVGATPVVQRAAGTAGDLATFSQAVKPATATLNASEDNIIAIVQNWSRAIQFRDGLSHVFRGSASVTPDTLETLVDRLLGPSALTPKREPAAARRPATAPAEPRAASTPPGPAPTGTVASPPPSANPIAGLLGGLLGAVHRTLGGTASGTTGPSGTQPAAAGQLPGLLHYLLGR